MTIDITEQPALRAAGVRHVGPYDKIGPAFGKLGAIAHRAGLIRPGTLMLGIYHNDPRTTDPSALQSDAVVSIAEGTAIPEGLTEVRVPGGRHATIRHLGPYETLPRSWAALMQSLTQNGTKRRQGPSYEIYRNDPSNTPPTGLITDIFVPVE